MLMEKERALIAEYGRRMSTAGLCPGTSGNLSIFDPALDLIAISPSGMDYFATEPEDVAVCRMDGSIADGVRKPSSELRLHTAFYQAKPESRAIVHTHSVYCTTFAVLGQPLQAVHYVIADAGGGTVPCAPYRCFGTEELARAAAESCGEGNAVLLANHGLVACGADMASAFSLAVNLEYVAELQYRAMCIGTPNVLTGSQIAQVLEKFKNYGQPNKK